MTSQEFHDLVEEHTKHSGAGDNDPPMTPAQLAKIELAKEIKLPEQYKEFLSTYGAGDFGTVTVLSPDPDSQFPIWESIARSENRGCAFLGVVDIDSDFYGFLIEQGVCSNDIWCADHDFEYKIDYTEYPDFFDFLAKVALGIWEGEET
jgi:hypothetical protein